MLRLFPGPSADVPASDGYDCIRFPEPPIDRPYVVLNFVTTLDGQATLGTGGAPAIGSATDHRLMRELRATADGLLHGAGTIRLDNFAPVVRDHLVSGRVARGLAPQPMGAIITRSGNLDPGLKYFSGRPPLVFTTAATAPGLAARLGRLATVVVAGTLDVDVRAVLEILRARYEIRTLLSEGGPQLAHSLLAVGCVDELFLTLAPKIGSERAAPRLVDGPPFPEHAVPKLDLVHVMSEGSELYLRYRTRR